MIAHSPSVRPAYGFTFLVLIVAILTLASVCAGVSGEVVIHPKPYSGALRNPLLGFIGPLNGRHEYATLSREYVKWNTVENDASDGADKLRAYSETRWRDVE